jgi:predicted TIM-barrel enzyme
VVTVGGAAGTGLAADAEAAGGVALAGASAAGVTALISPASRAF